MMSKKYHVRFAVTCRVLPSWILIQLNVKGDSLFANIVGICTQTSCLKSMKIYALQIMVITLLLANRIKNTIFMSKTDDNQSTD